MSQAWCEKNRHAEWSDTNAAILAPPSMPTTVRGGCAREQSGGQQHQQSERSIRGETQPETAGNANATSG